MSFFKAPSWAKPQVAQDEETEQDIFSHQNKYLAVQHERLEQEKRRAERKARKQREKEAERENKQKIKQERKTSVKRESTGDEGQGGLKKRRINSAEAAKLLKSVGAPTPITIDSDDDDATPGAESTPVRRSPRGKLGKDALRSPRTSSNLRSTVEVNDGSDGEVQITAAISKPAPAPASEPEEEEDSDPEIAALERNARERRKAANQKGQRTSTPATGASDGATGSDRRDTSLLPTPPHLDPTISLFISSDLPNTNQLLIKRKLSQTLEVVLKAWCSKQNFPPGFAEKVFLTFDGRRLWGFNTCQRLGLEVDSSGNIVRADAYDKDGAAQVHLIVMTEELLKEFKEDKARQAKIEHGEPEGEEEEEEEAEPEPEVEEELAAKQQIRLTVKAKGHPDHKVKLMSTTQLAKVIVSARKTFKIPDDQPVYLQFDGERLDPEETLGDTDLEDLDGVDLILGN